jgi:hypothetical protein
MCQRPVLPHFHWPDRLYRSLRLRLRGGLQRWSVHCCIRSILLLGCRLRSSPRLSGWRVRCHFQPCAMPDQRRLRPGKGLPKRNLCQLYTQQLLRGQRLRNGPILQERHMLLAPTQSAVLGGYGLCQRTSLPGRFVHYWINNHLQHQE